MLGPIDREHLRQFWREYGPLPVLAQLAAFEDEREAELTARAELLAAHEHGARAGALRVAIRVMPPLLAREA